MKTSTGSRIMMLVMELEMNAVVVQVEGIDGWDERREGERRKEKEQKKREGSSFALFAW